MLGIGRRTRRLTSPHPLRGFGGRQNVKSCVFLGSSVLPGGVDEIKTITISGSPGGGNFTLTFAGATTANIVYNAAASAVEDALELLTTIGNGNVRVTGSAGGPYSVTFLRNLGRQNVGTMTASGAGLTGGTTPSIAVVTATEGSDTDAGRLVVRRGLIIMQSASDTSKVIAWDGASATTPLGVLAQDWEFMSQSENPDLGYWGGPGCDFLAKNLTGFTGNEANFRTWAGVHGCVITEGTV